MRDTTLLHSVPTLTVDKMAYLIQFEKNAFGSAINFSRLRKMSIRGSDGNEYTFLLKGNEDPRQDERIMQLFGLINHLILREPDTNRRNLSIQVFYLFKNICKFLALFNYSIESNKWTYWLDS